MNNASLRCRLFGGRSNPLELSGHLVLGIASSALAQCQPFTPRNDGKFPGWRNRVLESEGEEEGGGINYALSSPICPTKFFKYSSLLVATVVFAKWNRCKLMAMT